jgi:hypothetical protein
MKIVITTNIYNRYILSKIHMIKMILFSFMRKLMRKLKKTYEDNIIIFNEKAKEDL